jgi:uncharacterized protein YjdB
MTQKLAIYQWVGLTLYIFFLTACIGEDVKQDTIQAIEITTNKTALLIDQTAQATATLQNPFEDKFTGEVAWISANPEVATIDNNGVITAKGLGQTNITATKDGVTSNQVVLTVVNSLTAVAMVNITAPATTVSIGNTLQLVANAQNINGDNVNSTNYTWSSDNASIATVSASGLVTAVANGVANITATTDGVSSQKFEITVGNGNQLTGVFNGRGSYNVSGNVTLKSTSNNNLELTLSSNFASSAGPGLHVYLSNSGTSASGGLEIAPLRKTSGSDTYLVTGGVNLDQYKYVLIYCKPFTVIFGVAELQ